MTRKLRLDPIDGWHHVMNRGVDRQPIFFGDEDRRELGRCLAVACRRFGVEIHAYCLMTNHFHLLLRCPDGHVSKMMQLACGLFATAVNKRIGRVGHLFGNRFCSRLVTTDEYIAYAVRYIHRNALAIDGVSTCGDYRWSSHQTYLGRRSAADFIRTDQVMNWFSDTAAFDAFVNGASSQQSALTEKAGTVLAFSTVDDLFGAIDQVIAERSILVGRSVLAQRRAIALEIAGRTTSGLRAKIVSELGLTSKGALSSAATRARKHLVNTPESSELVAGVLELVAPPSVRIDRAA